MGLVNKKPLRRLTRTDRRGNPEPIQCQRSSPSAQIYMHYIYYSNWAIWSIAGQNDRGNIDMESLVAYNRNIYSSNE